MSQNMDQVTHEMNGLSTASHSVHFPAEQVPQHESEINIVKTSDDTYEVHLGFLQIHHVYKVKFSIKDDLNEDLTCDPLQNLHAKVTSVKPSENGEGHDLEVDLQAHKEKIQKEELILVDSTNYDKFIRLVLQARVLGKGKGTPSIKSGVKCIGVNMEEDSEHSDWQGFD